MLPHFGDVDVMCHVGTLLAIPRGQPPPTHLPDEFHNNYVRVCEMVDSHLPGYVYLELRYLLTECSDERKYNAVEYDRDFYMSNHCLFEGDTHGPAVNIIQGGTHLSFDQVYCVRCLMWPPQAADWRTRQRNYGWPESATVDRVVNNGCDVVPVAHRQCRQHEWMGKRQWRLSFSRAEVVLLNNWMPVQQIVYHMLRVFMKAEGLTGDGDSGEMKLSNYQSKTLMLWACELKPRSWWTHDLSLVRICVELLHDLAVWLTEARFPHYFINKCNLVDNSLNLDISRLMSVSKSWLSLWFINNYILKCSQLCPRNVSRLFDDVSTSVRLQRAVSEIICWRLNSVQDRVQVFSYAEWVILSIVSTYSLTAWSLYRWLIELEKISPSFSMYFTAVAFLHIACKISINGFTDELMDILAAILGQFIGPPRYFNQHSSSRSLRKATKLMKVAGNDSHCIVQLKTELSREYLYRASRCKDADSDSIYCLANVYLAVLYYTTGQYQTAIDHCTLVTRSQDHSQCSSRVVQGELLPKINDGIDAVLGLAVFYQHVRRAALNQQQTQHVTVFTTELFAHYLHINCLSATKCQQLFDTALSQSIIYQVQNYAEYISDMQQLHIADVLLWNLVNRFSVQKYICEQHFQVCDYRKNNCHKQRNRSKVIELLQQAAFERLTTFRQLEEQHCGSIVTIVATEYQAVYAYKRGDYQLCLQLSTRNVHTLLYAVDLPEVPTLPEFIQLLDDDIVSLTALTVILNPECRRHTNDCSISQLTLSLYLMTQCQLKLRHSVTQSLSNTINYIEVAQRRIPLVRTLDHLTLKLSVRIALRHLNKTVD